MVSKFYGRKKTMLFLPGIVLLITFFSVSKSNAQVSLPERNPLKWSFSGGFISNNADQQASLRTKADNKIPYTVNLDYAAVGESELAIDLIRFHGAGIGMQVAGLYSHPEFKSYGTDGTHRVGLTQLEMLRANLTVSFNGTDPYTMFELPYHSNKEAVLGICAMIIRTEKTSLTTYATDSLGIKNMDGNYCQAAGITFGWNWRLGESGWVIGLNGAVMFVVNKSHLEKIETSDSSPFYSGVIDFAPRVFTAGIGYHF